MKMKMKWKAMKLNELNHRRENVINCISDRNVSIEYPLNCGLVNVNVTTTI